MPNIESGEGVAQPEILPKRVVVKPRFLPAPLIRARAEAFNPRNCLDLSRPARHALFGILAFFDIRRPFEPVFASRDNICAESLLGSHPTLYRGLADLVTKGYIRRLQCRRLAQSTYGQYSISRIWLEEKALRALGLFDCKRAIDGSQPATRCDEAPSAPEPTTTFPQGPSLIVRDRLQESDLSPSTQLSSKEQPHASADAQPQANDPGELSSEPIIKTKTRLPTELTRLIGLGMSKPQICTLMKLAREHGNGGMLGSVVELVWHRLEGRLHGRSAFAYLAKLVSQRKNYSRMLQVRGESDDKNGLAKNLLARLSSKLPIFLERSKGMELTTREGRVLGTVQCSGGSGFVEGFDEQGHLRVIPVNMRMIQKWEEGDLRLKRRPEYRETGIAWAA